MKKMHLECVRCGEIYSVSFHARQCEVCAPEVPAALTVSYLNPPLSDITKEQLASGARSIWRYEHSLPVAADQAISLGEGLTPLIELKNIGADIDLPNLYGKCEFANPTGSFKDRLASSAISAAHSLFDAKVIASSSTGNAGAASAAYASKAGMKCVIFTTAEASGPIVAQMLAYGAIVTATPSKADRWMLLKEGVERLGWFPTSPYFGPPVGSNPFGIEGYKSLAYEIAADLDWSVPDWLILPVCYGDALYGMWKGFCELLDFGWIERMPRFVAAEIYGSLCAAFDTDAETPPLMNQSYATAAKSITAPQGTYQALAVLKKTGGRPVRIGEDALIAARIAMAAREGLYIETSAAAAVAAADSLRRDGTFRVTDRVVCVLTAGGLKDAPREGAQERTILHVPANLDGMLRTVREVEGLDLSEGM